MSGSSSVGQGELRWSTLGALFFIAFASAGLLIAKPLIVGALIDDYHFSPQQAGLIAGIEMVGIGLAALLVGAFGAVWKRRTVIAAGATLGMVGSLVPLVSQAFVGVLALRLIAGLGTGLIAGGALSMIGTTRDPDRIFGLYFMSFYVATAVFFPIASLTILRFGADGGYALLALLLAAGFATARVIPNTTVAKRTESGVLPPFPVGRAVMSLSVSVVFWIGNGAVWAFVERLGLAAGASHGQVGTILSVCQLALIGGAVIAALLHTRLGRSLPTLGAILISMFGLVLISWGHSLGSFAAGVLLICLGWPLFLTYLNGTMAAQDPAGRIVALGVASQTIGMAIGPAVAGAFAGSYGYEPVVTMGLTSYVAAICLLAPLVLSESAGQRAARFRATLSK